MGGKWREAYFMSDSDDRSSASATAWVAGKWVERPPQSGDLQTGELAGAELGAVFDLDFATAVVTSENVTIGNGAPTTKAPIAGDLSSWRATSQDRLLPDVYPNGHSAGMHHTAARIFDLTRQPGSQQSLSSVQTLPATTAVKSRAITIPGTRLRRLANARPNQRPRERATDVTRENIDQVLSDLDKSVASLKLAEVQNHRLEREVEMLRREFARLHSAKRATDLDMLETRRAIKEFERRLAKVRETISWQIGSALVDSAQSFRAVMHLPSRLHMVFKSSRQLRRRWSDASRSVPQNLVESAESVHLASAALEVMAAQDAVRAAAWARGQSPKPMILANALIEIASAIAKHDPSLAATLGTEAIELSPIEGRVKHLAFQLGDFGHVQAAVTLVDKAATAGAKFNISETKKAEGLRALQRLMLSPPKVMRHEVTTPRSAEPRVAFVGRESLPFQSTAASLRLHDRAVMAERCGWRATIIPMPGSGGAHAQSLPDEAYSRSKFGSIEVVKPATGEHPVEVADLYISYAAASIASAAIQEGAGVIRTDAFFASGLAAAMAARSIGCPLIVDVDDLLDPHDPYHAGFERSEKGQIQLRMTVQTACAADICVVSSPRMMKLLLNVGVSPNRIVHAPHRYPTTEVDRDELNSFGRSLGLGVGPVVGVVRDLCSSYDSNALADILARLTAEFPTIKLLVVGAGRAADGLRRRVAEHNLGHSLILVEEPRPEDMPRYRALMDVTLFTRLDTTKSALIQPYEVLAALAQSRACVAFRTIDAAEVIEDGVSGLLCTAGDVDAMANAAAALLRDPERRLDLGQRAGIAYVQAVGRETAPRQLADLYAGLTAGHA